MSRFVSTLALGAVIALSVAGSAVAGSLQFQSSLETRGIIIVSGKGGEASLNPQPLPPKEKARLFVGGSGGEACLNPQPLPPGGKGSATCLNPQPLPPGGIFTAF